MGELVGAFPRETATGDAPTARPDLVVLVAMSDPALTNWGADQSRDRPARRLAGRARPAPAPGHVLHDADPDLFWSLSFACSRGTWLESDGFHEEFIGHGAEDTDLAQQATCRGLTFGWGRQPVVAGGVQTSPQ